MFITRILSVAYSTTKNKKFKIALLLLLEIAIVAFVYNQTKNKLQTKKLNKNINKE